MTYENQALRDLAQGQPCVACGLQDDTTVMCHLPYHGIADHGTGEKCDDFWSAWLCQRCHFYADHGEGRKDLFWRTRMIYRTQRQLFRYGHLQVSKKRRLVA